MFGHFKAEEFLNLIEGEQLSQDRRAHLDSCTACSTRLQSVQSVHIDLSTSSMISMQETDIPEPDWDEFRTSVRNELLSRSVQRESSVNRWTGWAIRPAMAWGLSFGVFVCLMAGGFLWHLSTDRLAASRDAQFAESAVDAQEPSLDLSVNPAAVDPATIEPEIAVWRSTHIFEEVAQLKDEQAEQLRRSLAAAPMEKGTLNQQ